MENKQMIHFFSKHIAIAFVVCCTTAVFAQMPQVDEAIAKFPDASAMYLVKKHAYSIYMENNKLKGLCNVHEQVYINKETGRGNQYDKIHTNSFVEVKNIKAYTLVPKNKKYEKKEVKDIELKDNTNRSSFYDDDKTYQLTYPGVQPGCVLDLSYQQIYNDPRFMGRFFWADYLPSLEGEIVISTQKGINIGFKLFNCENQPLVYTKEETKTEVIHRWKIKDADAGKYYNDAPNYTYYEPHIVFFVTDYIKEGKVTPLLGSPKDLHNWYMELQKYVNKVEDKNLRQITDSLVVGITDEFQKVEKIFYWVQDNISYVAFEDGLGGFIARDAGLVCSRKYGDCKDMASTIREMLRMAGVKSFLTWIGSRDIPYDYTDVPSSYTDNHMIATYLDKNGKWWFLDATGKEAPIDQFTSFIQGKQALVSVDKDSFLLVRVPMQDTSRNQVVDSVFINVENNIVEGIGKVSLTGYDRLNYLYKNDRANKKEREDFFRGYFFKGNNKVNFYDIVELDSTRTTPLLFDYKFKIPDYARTNQNELYINLNMGSMYGLESIDIDRKQPVAFYHLTKKKLIVTLTIPEGYKIDHVPADARFDSEGQGFSIFYIQTQNKIVCTSELYHSSMLLYPKDFKTFNQFLSERIKATKQTISLKKL